MQVNMTDFTQQTKANQDLFIGIDVHLRNWKVCIRTSSIEVNVFSCEPEPIILHKFLQRNFANYDYYSVYEAGFCGFWIHHEFIRLGINNIIVNAADVATTNKEKTNKSDVVDCKKLARELENKNLSAIFVPSEYEIQFRSFFRYRQQVAKDLRKSMIRITAFLYTRGKHFEGPNWTVAFIKWMKSDHDFLPIEKSTLMSLINDYEYHKKKSRQVLRDAQNYVLSDEHYKAVYQRLRKIPGIGPVCAVAFICEINNMKRFKNENQFASYVGLVPSVRSSDQTEHVLGVQRRAKKILRSLLIQATWMAIRKDSALLEYYGESVKRMKPQKAIIKVAKKLLNRIRYVWLNEKDYVYGLIK